MKKPRALILSGYGLNCEDETCFAFNAAGADAKIMHVNDLIKERSALWHSQILAVPGGFSYGDDTGSGKAYANKLKNHLSDALREFIGAGKLVIGICNGFQILTNLGLLPSALIANDSARYLDRWVDLKITGRGPWLRGITALSLPIAHGEGKFFADPRTLRALTAERRIAAVYTKGKICEYQNLHPNPNGSIKNIAGVTSEEGRVLGLMPHPERAMFFTQLPHWPYLKERYVRAGKKLPVFGPGFQIFKNAVSYFLQ